MTAPGESFRETLLWLWLRLSTVAIVGLLFFFALVLPERISGWRFYLSVSEVAFEVAVFTIVVALAGLVVGTLCTAGIAPFLLRPASRRRIAEVASMVAVAIAAFVDFGSGLKVLIEWAGGGRTAKFALLLCYYFAFAAALLIPRRRKQVVTSLDGLLEGKSTRRAVIATGVATAALITAEAAIGKVASAPLTPKRASPPSGPNILLVTFDALSAEDMSLYGYGLPTTPQIDNFARRSSVFTNSYSASTFTTSSIATILTGLHPSEHHVYHVPGRLHGPDARKTFPHLMRAAGYTTGASISNPTAYFLAQGITDDYDNLPDPACRNPGLMQLWEATGILHQRQPYGSPLTEYWDLEVAWDYFPNELNILSDRVFARTQSRFPPAASFLQAREMMERMPDHFFQWVHIYAPHDPYLPSAANAGRFLASGDMRTLQQQLPHPFRPVYGPELQVYVNQARLRYDEFIADADSAFGVFMEGLEKAGRLRNTAVIVAADHGESFEGGLYQHASPHQTRPEIHIPLIIRMPGQERGFRMSNIVDQTAIAPTILDIAGIPRRDWMRGDSLVPWLKRDNEGEGQGLAFTQYLETNSIFKPLHHGTVGVIDGRHQYVLDLDSGKGILRGLAEAQSWDLDRSAENPALAKTLRDAIYARFPDLPREFA